MRKCIMVGGANGSGTCWLTQLIGDYIAAPIFVDFDQFDKDGVVKHETFFSDIPSDVEVTDNFYIIRDIRDCFISRYYKITRNSKFGFLQNYHSFLKNWTEHNMSALQYYNKVVNQWLDSPYPGTTYEKLLKNPYEEFQALLEKAGWEIDIQKIRSVIDKNEFNIAKKRGNYGWSSKSNTTCHEDDHQYYRKGKAGYGKRLPKDIQKILLNGMRKTPS